MAVRIMVYIGLLYQYLIDSQNLTKKDKLPPVLPVVIYNGKATWTAAQEFDNRYALDPSTAVFGDLKMIWGIPGLKEPAPDIAIVPHIKEKEKERSRFEVLKEGTRPSLVIEVISPQYPGDDTNKVEIYEQAGVSEYIIIHPHSDKPEPYYDIWGYRLQKGKYQPIKPDKHGRLLSKTTQVLFGVYQKGRSLKLTDAKTKKGLLNARETEAALLKSEESLLKETRARIEAEEQAYAEATARIEAEQRVLAETQARIQLEKRLLDQAETYAELEKRLRTLLKEQ